MTPFPDREVAVRMTGREWTALLGRIVGSTPHPGYLSALGREQFNIASGKLQEQLMAASSASPGGDVVPLFGSKRKSGHDGESR